jgi:exodeoxyribonuclease VII large subunit
MEQIELFAQPEQSYSVSQVTIKLRELIESQADFQALWVQGEVSNFSKPQSGHLYFTIKDEGAELRCVMWRGMASNQSYLPQNGDAIEVHGSISIYESRGQYQLYADEIRPAGEGALYQEFLRLKATLEEEGLFEAEHKQAIPERPARIGVISSATGAALRDILDTLGRRYPLGEVVLAPASVQGPKAPKALLAALRGLEGLGDVDVIILARGGGLIEDLAAFNDEALARAIFNSEVPIVSGVGHETDFSISDFVADLRAPTPTAAAELVSPDKSILQNEIQSLRGQIEEIIDQRWQLQSAEHALDMRSPQARIANELGELDRLGQRMIFGLQATYSTLGSNLSGLQSKLNALNPIKILERGFAIVSDETGKVLRKATLVEADALLQVRLSEGEMKARVSKK